MCWVLGLCREYGQCCRHHSSCGTTRRIAGPAKDDLFEWLAAFPVSAVQSQNEVAPGPTPKPETLNPKNPKLRCWRAVDLSPVCCSRTPIDRLRRRRQPFPIGVFVRFKS